MYQSTLKCMLTLGCLVGAASTALLVASDSISQPEASVPLAVTAKLDHPAEAQEHYRGFWVVIGVQDVGLLQELADRSQGKALIQGLCVDQATTNKLAQEIVAAGIQPLVTVRTMRDPANLPYVDQLASVVVVNEPGLGGTSIPETELERILFFNRPLVRGGNGSWTAITQPMPDDVGEWTHGVINPQRLPISKEARLGPWVNGLRWMVGDVDATQRDRKGKPSYRSQGSLSPLGIRLVDGVAVAVSSVGKRQGMFLRAFDAANGLPLWDREMKAKPQRQGGSGFFISSDIFIATKEGVFAYVGDGSLCRLDLHTGEELNRYEHGVQFEVTTKGRLVTVADSVSLTVNVFDGKILQSYRDKMKLLEIESGKVIWEFSESDSHVLSPCLGDDGRIYAVLTEQILDPGKNKFHETTPPPKAVICLDPDTGKVAWRTVVDAKFIEGISGPQGGYLPIVGNLNISPKQKPQWNDGTMMIDARSGEVLWKIKGGGGARGYGFMRNGEVVITGALSSVTFHEASTGKRLRNMSYGGNSGGCGFETFTQNYLVRGQMLSPVDNFDKVYAAAGFRPACQIPVFTGYGRMYSTMTTCGCGFYLPFTFAAAGPHVPQPHVDSGSRTQQYSLPVIKGALPKPSYQESLLSEMWPAIKDSLKGNKQTRFSDVSKEMRQTIDGTIGKSQGEGATGLWYGREVADQSVGGLTIRVDPHRHAVSAMQGEQATWTTVFGARVGSEPLSIGDALYVPSHDGYLTKLSLGSGEVIWRVLVAPHHQQMMAFGQIESVWPCMGVTAHNGKIYTTAGRSSTLDNGIYAAQIDPKTGKVDWYHRMSAESMEFAEPKDLIGNAAGGRKSPAGWSVKRGAWPGQPFGRARMSVNAPPMITDDKLHVNGAIWIDLKDPKDHLYFNNDGEIIGGQ